jgi:hypothetical protein
MGHKNLSMTARKTAVEASTTTKIDPDGILK